MSFNVGTIGTIVVLLLILGFLFYKKRSDEKGKEEIKKFLETLQEDFENIIIEYIDKLDISNLDNLALAEQEIINALIDNLWIKATTALDGYVTDPLTKAIMKKYLTREYVESFTIKVFEQAKVQIKYTAKYNNAILAANREAILLEAGIVEENDKINRNDPEDFREVPDIAPDAILDGNGDIVDRKVNPPHDEEPIEVDPEEDSSIEVLE